jgi:hypothetical protein
MWFERERAAYLIIGSSPLDMNTTTHIPSDEELSAAVEKLEGSLGVAKTLSRVRELHPSWTLDSKVLLSGVPL